MIGGVHRAVILLRNNSKGDLMATRRDANPQAAANSGANAITFDRFSGVCALITGLSSVLYAVFFLLVKGSLNTYLPSVFLALGGFLALPPLIAVYQRVRRAEEGFALWAMLLAAVG